MDESKFARRNLLGLVASGAVVASSAGSAQAEENSVWQRIRSTKKFRLGCAAAEPFYFKDPATEKWDGICYRFGERLAKELDAELVPVEATWPNAVAALQADQYDALFGFDATPSRALVLDFPLTPFFYLALGMLVRPEATATTWAELNNDKWRIGVILGTSADEEVRLRAPNAHVERFPSPDELYAAFVARRVDAVCQFTVLASMYLQKIHVPGKIMTPRPVRAGVTSGGIRRENDKTFRDWLTLTTMYLYEAGDIQRMYEAYLVARGQDPTTAPPIMRDRFPSSN